MPKHYPEVLKNKKYLNKIEKLLTLRENWKTGIAIMNTYILEDFKYKININQPLTNADCAFVSDLYKTYFGSK